VLSARSGADGKRVRDARAMPNQESDMLIATRLLLLNCGIGSALPHPRRRASGTR